MSSPPKKKRVEKPQLDNLQKAAIRQCIHKFHIDYKLSPTTTLKKMHQILVRRIQFGGDKSALRNILHALGFRWKKTKDYQKLLIEKDSIRAKRPGYLREIASYRAEGRPIVFTVESFIDNPDVTLPTISEEANEIIEVVLETENVSEVKQEDEATREAKFKEACKAVEAMLESSGESNGVKVEDIDQIGETSRTVDFGETIDETTAEVVKTIDAMLEECEKANEARLEASQSVEISLEAMLEQSDRSCEAMLAEYDKINRPSADKSEEMTFEAMLAGTSEKLIEVSNDDASKTIEAMLQGTDKNNSAEEADALEKLIKFTLEKKSKPIACTSRESMSKPIACTSRESISKPIACTSRETGEILQCTSKETGETFQCPLKDRTKTIPAISKETGEPIESSSKAKVCAKTSEYALKQTDKIIEETLEEIFKEIEGTSKKNTPADDKKETDIPIIVKSKEKGKLKKKVSSKEIIDNPTQGTSKETAELKVSSVKKSDNANKDAISKISRLNVVLAVGEDSYSPNSLLIYEAKPKVHSGYKTSSKTYERWLQEKLLPKLQPKSVIVVDIDSTHNKDSNCVPSWYSSTKATMEAWLTKNNISFPQDTSRAELCQLIRSNKKNHVKEYELDKVLKENGHVVLRRLSNHHDLNPLETIWSKVQTNITPKLVNNFNTSSIRMVLNDVIKETVKKDWANECKNVKEREEKYMEFEYIMDDITDNVALLDEDQSEYSHSDSSSDADLFIELDSDDDWSDLDSSNSGSSFSSWEDVSDSGSKSTKYSDQL